METALWVLGGLAGLIVLFLAYLGFLYLTKSVPVERVRAPGSHDGVPGAEDKRFGSLASFLTKTELARGHRVELMTCGDELYPRMWQDLRSAKHSITIQMYYCQPGRMADEFAEILIERAKAGVRVLFLRDAFGAQKLTAEYLERLRAAGVTESAFRPTKVWELHKAQHRSHIRVVVIDGRVGYTGGFGLDDKWFGDGKHEGQWRDTSVRFEGPAVLQLQGSFAAGWAEATGDLLTSELFFPIDLTHSEDGMLAGLLYAAPTVGSTAAERYLAISIAGAQRTLYIANSYFVPSDEFCGLIENAASRGVDVRVLTPGPDSDVKSTYYAGRVNVERLLRAGVRIYEYRPAMMHSKSIVTDGVWGSVGSLNFDNRSMSFNDETVLLVHDRRFGEAMDAMFMRDLEHSEEITLEKHLRRPWKRKVLERGAALLFRWL